MSDYLFIRNPYLAMVLAIVITLCGLLAITAMPLAQYPDVTPPQITVTANYPGADAPTLLDSVVTPLEEQINGAPDMIYMESASSGSGQAVITVTFAIGSDAEQNRQNVQDRVNWASSLLPQAVQQEGVIVREQSGNILLGVSLYSTTGVYDTLFMSNYAAIHLKDTLARVPGVARVQLFGGSEYAMRIWLKQEKCAALGLSTEEIVNALKSQNIQVSSGGIGQAPAPPGQRFTCDIRVRGRLMNEKEFGDIIVRSAPNGAQVRLREVARVEQGAESYSTSCTLNGNPAIILVVFQQNNANGLAISKECRRIVHEKEKDFPPGLTAGFQYDSTTFVREGIKDVVHTLILAVVLVSAVTLLFLRDWRMALIPALAIPVSIIGTFAVLKLIGYSINMISLFALTLAIGIVVDDAIIVIENVSRLMEEEHLSPEKAAEKSMKQITGAIAATTAVLMAMFIPICFFPGITGELYRQFGITISIAVLISAFNALTLSPALSAMILKPHEKPSDLFIFRWFDAGFNRFSGVSAGLLKKMIRFAVPTLLIFLIPTALAFVWYAHRPTGFLPQEDQGYFFAAVRLPPDAGLQQTEKTTGELVRILKDQPGVSDVIAIPGYNILNSTPAENNAFVIAILRPWSERLKKGETAERILERAQFLSFEEVPGALCMMFQPPAIPGIGTAGGFNFVIREGSSPDPFRLAGIVDEFLMAAMRRPELSNVFCAYTADTPAVRLNVDREKALRLGVPVDAVNRVLENMLGYRFINQYNRFGQVYKVEIQADAKDRAEIRDLLDFHVPNSNGRMVPMASIATVSRTWSAAFLSRHNMRLSAQIQGSPGAGYSSSEAMTVMKQLGSRILPDDMSYEWTDMSYQEQKAGNQAPWILLLAVVFIFLFLSALYASWMLPWAVLAAIPMALLGALGLLALTGHPNNLYTQIGLVLLFGMACKTAILVADFAKQRHAEGETPELAASYAAHLRFRAVMMTSGAFIFGTLPLAFSHGAGAAGQQAIGIPVVGGMIGTIIGALFLCPVLYTLTTRFSEYAGGKEKK